MNLASTQPHSQAHPLSQERRRLYGLCVLLTLTLLLAGSNYNDFSGSVLVNFPFLGATLLMIGLAGVEYHLFLREIARVRADERARHEEVEHQVILRQQTFNRLWQTLADCRGQVLPHDVPVKLVELFTADLVAVWSPDTASDGYTLRASYPLEHAGAVRLDRVAHMSPCFHLLEREQRLLPITAIERDTTKAFAWFCEENGYQQAVLCPVLVRHNLVGVLALFYRQKREFSSRQLEEMQSAANLFLCAL